MKRILALLLLFLLLPISANAIEIVRQKNVATYITIPIVDADGDIVTAATGLDSEIDTWTDGAFPNGFIDCTNEATEVGTTGIYYLSLTQAEMNVDYIYIRVQTTSAGAKTQHILIRTQIGDPLLYATTDDGGVINVTAGAIDNVDLVDLTTTTTTATTTSTCTSVTNPVTITSNADITAILADTSAMDTSTELRTLLTGSDTAVSILTTGSTIAGVTTAATCTNLTNAPTAGDFTTTMKTSLNAATPASVVGAVGSVTGAVGSVTGNVGGNVVGSVASVTGAVGSVTGGVTVTTNNDKTGYALSAAGVDAIWDEAASGHTTSGTYGQYLQIVRTGTAQAGAATSITLDAGASATNNLYQNQAIYILSGTGAGQTNKISSYDGTTKIAIVSTTWATNPAVDSVFIIYPEHILTGTGASAAEVWGYATRALTDKAGFSLASPQTFNLTGNITGNLSGSVGSVTGAVGSVTADVNVADTDVAQAVWNAATASYGSAGSYGLLIETNLDAAISSRSTLTTLDNIGINWADISNPTTAQGLSATTIGICTSVTNDVNLLDATETQIDTIETKIKRLVP